MDINVFKLKFMRQFISWVISKLTKHIEEVEKRRPGQGELQKGLFSFCILLFPCCLKVFGKNASIPVHTFTFEYCVIQTTSFFNHLSNIIDKMNFFENNRIQNNTTQYMHDITKIYILFYYDTKVCKNRFVQCNIAAA